MKFVSLSIAIAMLAFPFLDEQEERVMERGRACCQSFFDGEVDGLWEDFDEAMRKVLGSLENLDAFHLQMGTQLGNEKEVLEETVSAQGGGWGYVRTARFENTSQLIEVRLSFDARDRISGFLIRPAPTEAPSEFLDYKTKTELRLPFEHGWDVFWGGRSLKDNYHTAFADQRFAYDILIIEDGSTHTGKGKKNEDYHCFGRPVLAPGAGVVAVVVKGVKDNVPGQMNPKQAAGNHVIIDHGNGEYSLLAHFKKGTLAVAKGDEIEGGQLLGRCGNSGNSSEPHLHYHLQNSATFGRGMGLPAQFVDYVANGLAVERGEPVKGQRIRRP